MQAFERMTVSMRKNANSAKFPYAIVLQKGITRT
jgi:hypothetical protein